MAGLTTGKRRLICRALARDCGGAVFAFDAPYAAILRGLPPIEEEYKNDYPTTKSEEELDREADFMQYVPPNKPLWYIANVFV